MRKLGVFEKRDDKEEQNLRREFRTKKSIEDDRKWKRRTKGSKDERFDGSKAVGISRAFFLFILRDKRSKSWNPPFISRIPILLETLKSKEKLIAKTTTSH